MFLYYWHITFWNCATRDWSSSDNDTIHYRVSGPTSSQLVAEKKMFCHFFMQKKMISDISALCYVAPLREVNIFCIDFLLLECFTFLLKLYFLRSCWAS